MLLSKASAVSFTIPGGTVGSLYPSHPNGEHTLALVETNGVYPERGWSMNDRCTETLFMLDGAFTLFVGSERILLKSNDAYIILPNNKYRIEGTGKALVVITPKWDKTQNHIIES